MPTDKEKHKSKLRHGVTLTNDPAGSSVQLYSVSHHEQEIIDRVKKANQERVDAYKKYPPGDKLEKKLADIEKQMVRSVGLKNGGFTKNGFLIEAGDSLFQMIPGTPMGLTPFSDWMTPTAEEEEANRKHYNPDPAMFAEANQEGLHNRPNQPAAQFHPQTTALETSSQWQPSMAAPQTQTPYFPPIEHQQNHTQPQVREEDVRLNFWSARLATAGYNPVQQANGSVSFFAKDAKRGDPPLANVERDTGRISIAQTAGQNTYDNVMETLKAGGEKGITILGNPSMETVDMIQKAAEKQGLNVNFGNPKLEMAWNEFQAQRVAAMEPSAPSHSSTPSASSSVASSTEPSPSSSYNPSTSSSTVTTPDWSRMPSRKPSVSRLASTSNVIDLSQVNSKLKQNAGQSFMDWVEKNKHTYTKDEQGNYFHKDKPDTVAFSIKSTDEGILHLELPSKNSPIIGELGKMTISKGEVKVTAAHKEDAHELWKQAALNGTLLTVNGFTPTPEQTCALARESLHNHHPTYPSQKGQFTQTVSAAKEGDVIPKESTILCRLQGTNGGAIVAVPPAKTDGRPIKDHNKKTWELKEISAAQLKGMDLDDKRQGHVLREPLVVGRSQEESRKMAAEQTKAKAQSASPANTTPAKGNGRR